MHVYTHILCVFMHTNGQNEQSKRGRDRDEQKWRNPRFYAGIHRFFFVFFFGCGFMENKSKAQESKEKRQKHTTTKNRKNKICICDKRKINWQDWMKENEIDENRKWNNHILLSSGYFGYDGKNSLFVNCEYGDGYGNSATSPHDNWLLNNTITNTHTHIHRYIIYTHICMNVFDHSIFCVSI